MDIIKSKWWALAFSVFAAGCATIDQRSGFDQVEKLVAERLPQRVQWHQEVSADAAVADAIASMLKDELTLDEAVQIALLNNRNLQAKFEDLGISQAELVQAGLLQNPVFSAERLKSDVGVATSFGVLQDFLSILSLPLRTKVSQASFEQTQNEVALAVLDLASEVKAAYHSAQAETQALELYKQVAEATQAAAELAERQYQAGNASRLDQSNQQAFYAQALLDAGRVETQEFSAREKLNRLLGLWGKHTSWKLTPRLPELPAALKPSDDFEQLAIAQRLDLAAAKKEVESLSYSLGYARTWGTANVLDIGYSRNRESDGELLKGPQIEFSLPIFDQGQGVRHRALGKLRQAEQRLTALAVDIRSQVREGWNRLAGMQQQAKFYAEVLLPIRRRVTQEMQLRYNAMLEGVFQLLNAKQNEIETAREYIYALRDYWLAYGDFEKALGGPVPAGIVTTAPKSLIDTPAAAPTVPAPGVHQHGGK